MRADVELSVRPSSQPALVRADRSQLEQVVMNLAVNGGEAMPAGGRLELSTETVELTALADGGSPQPRRWVRLDVADDGCGMTPEVQGRIFEPYFTTRATRGGTGLGLATVYGIVTQSEGHISVASEPGRGTTFTVHLPRAEEAAARRQGDAELVERGAALE